MGLEAGLTTCAVVAGGCIAAVWKAVLAALMAGAGGFKAAEWRSLRKFSRFESADSMAASVVRLRWRREERRSSFSSIACWRSASSRSASEVADAISSFCRRRAKVVVVCSASSCWQVVRSAEDCTCSTQSASLSRETWSSCCRMADGMTLQNPAQ